MVHICKAFGFLPLTHSWAVKCTHLLFTEKGHQAFLLCYTVSQERSSHRYTLIKYGINWPPLLCKKAVKGTVHHLQLTYNLSSPIRYALQQVWWIHLFPYCNNADKSNFGSSPTAFKAGAPHFQSLPLFFFSLSAAKCHQFTLAWGPISSFTANIREMHFSSCYHLTVLISATQGTQYCLHILLYGISTDAKTLPGLWRRRLLSVLWDFLDLWLSQWS